MLVNTVTEPTQADYGHVTITDITRPPNDSRDLDEILKSGAAGITDNHSSIYERLSFTDHLKLAFRLNLLPEKDISISNNESLTWISQTKLS